MAEYSGFFNSEAGDIREYNASEFAEYFSRFLSDGVYSENGQLGLKTTADGLGVNVASGFAYINGYIYKNDNELHKAIEAPDTVLNRIDRIVLKLDVVAREVTIEVKKGQFASSPTPPTLEETATVKELSLAQVRVNKNATTVIVTDERLTEHCGQVTLLIDVPLQDMLNEWEQWKLDNQTEYNTWLQTSKNDYIAWLNDLQDLLDENVAGNLGLLIETNRVDIEANAGSIQLNALDILTLQDEKMDKTKITISNLDADVTLMGENDIWIKYE